MNEEDDEKITDKKWFWPVVGSAIALFVIIIVIVILKVKQKSKGMVGGSALNQNVIVPLMLLGGLYSFIKE